MLLTLMSAPDVSFDEVLVAVLALNTLFMSVLTFVPKLHNAITK